MKNKKGFTLVEVLVTVLIFTVVILIAAGIFASAIRAQRYNLAYQELLDQTSYVMEYMSRQIRMAKKATDNSCIPQDTNYHTISEDIKFIDQDEKCTEFLIDSGQLTERKEGTTELPITSPYLTVDDFDVTIDGDAAGDNEQPCVEISLKINGKEDTSIKIQTTISQRDLDY